MFCIILKELPVHGGRFKQVFSKENLEQLKNYIIYIER